jgi:hypothetical protein
MFEEGVKIFHVFVSVSIDCMTRYNPYKNKSCSITLKVENWLEMKKSCVEGGGFGVFALCNFHPREFISVYLGEKINYTYMYKDIVSLTNNSKNNGFQEEYWLGHRINHCSGREKNVEMRGNYVLCTTKKIKKLEMNYFRTTTMTVFAVFVKSMNSS